MMRTIFLGWFMALTFHVSAQDQPGSIQFWERLQAHCGQAYGGEIVAGGAQGDAFTGKKLVMHVRACEGNTIRIPFFVGEDKSRTWVFTLVQNQRIQLKHDHRLEDGTEEEITQYGGRSPNTGLANIQLFPADQETADLIPYASTNTWWVTVDDSSFTYNLRRMGSDRFFSVKFDLTQPLAVPSAPWGTND